MDTKRALRLLSVMIPLLWLASNAAAAPAWNFDAPHGEVNFKIKHILTYVSGQFEQYGGTVKFDPDDPAGGSIDVSIEVKSVNTREKKRDQHLLTKDFFDAKKYPQITFKSSQILHKGGNEYVARGTLTIKDVSREFELPFTFLGIVDNPFNDKQLIAGFNSEFTVDRLEYHVGDGKYYKLGQVGKDVTVTLHFELLREK